MQSQPGVPLGSHLWLAAAALMTVAHSVYLVSREPSPISGVAAGLFVVAAVFLLRGSRVAWLLVLANAAGRIIESALSGEELALLVPAGAVVACLCVPTSVRYVWSEGPVRRSRSGLKVLDGARVWVWKVIAALASGEGELKGSDGPGKRRSYRYLIEHLGIACVLLIGLVALCGLWQEGSGGDSAAVEVVSDIVWVVYVIVQVAFLAAVAAAVRQRVGAGRERRRG